MELTADQVAWHRIRRSGLVTRFDSAVTAAEALVGVQAQFVPCAGLSLRNRLSQDFSAADLDEHLHVEKSLVRTWGQRNTVHVYSIADWPVVVAATQRLSLYQDRFLKQFGGDAAEMAEAVGRTGRYLATVERASRAEIVEADPSLERWFELGNGLIMDLARRGEVCHAGLTGSRSYFANRGVWLPGLAWRPPATDDACVQLARRYLATYGPASVDDLAFWFGSGKRDAVAWVEALAGELETVSVSGAELLAVARTLDDVVDELPPRSKWPVRLLHRFDPLLLAHKDKRWIAADQHYKAVWRKAGYVEAVALVRGRVAGTWRYDRKSRGVDVRIDLFGSVSKAARRALGKEAESVAAYFNQPLRTFQIE